MAGFRPRDPNKNDTNLVDIGIPTATSVPQYSQHHYEVRNAILRVIESSAATGLNTQTIEALVKFHISQFPSINQANQLKAKMREIYNSCVKMTGKRESDLTQDELTEIKMEMLMSIESLISRIMDEDTGIRTRVTIGVI